jgi:hypothetical protein
MNTQTITIYNTSGIPPRRGWVTVTATKKGIIVKYDNHWVEFYRDRNYPVFPHTWSAVISNYMVTAGHVWLRDLKSHTPDRRWSR